MTPRRLIVCLDLQAGRVVKGVSFEALRDQGDPVTLAARAEAEGADELVLLDIGGGTGDRRADFLDTVRRVTRILSTPVAVGGGINSVADIARALAAGARKVSINTAAVLNPALLSEAAGRFGSERVMASIDAKRVVGAPAAQPAGQPEPAVMLPGDPPLPPLPPLPEPGGTTPRFRVFTHGGRTPTPFDAIAWARECVTRGAGELLVTSIDRDGRRDGFDLELTSLIADAVGAPVIASGGAGSANHFRELFTETNAAAGLAAGIFHDGTTTPAAVKQSLIRAGIAVRTTGIRR